MLALEFRKADHIDVLTCTRLCPLHGAPRMLHRNLENLTGRSLVLHGVPVNPGLLRRGDIVAGFRILCVQRCRGCGQFLARALGKQRRQFKFSQKLCRDIGCVHPVLRITGMGLLAVNESSQQQFPD